VPRTRTRELANHAAFDGSSGYRRDGTVVATASKRRRRRRQPNQEKQRMSQHRKQAKARRSDEHKHEHKHEHELDDAELEAVIGGAAFLSGSLTTQQIAAARVDIDVGAQGFIMKDSIIVRTSR
jgi:hypothetical protein